MENKNAIIAAVVVIIVIIAAAGVYLAFGNNGGDNGGDDETPGVTFLIQDDQGMYFWIDGQGETVMAAFQDAVETFDIPYEPSVDADGSVYGIQSIFGMEMTSDAEGNWTWWGQYTWTDGAWAFANVGMAEMTPEDTSNYFAIVYGDGSVDLTTLATPEDAVVWDGQNSGTLFTIKSSSGMYFQVDGSGTTVLDALEDAVETYKIPFEPSRDADGNSYGIQSIFGMEMASDADGNWTWWGQFSKEDGNWVQTQYMMSELQSADYAEFGLSYGSGEF